MSRLIYAEDVKALINGLDSLPFEEEVDDLVDRIPTAFDVDKVVKKLEELKNIHYVRFDRYMKQGQKDLGKKHLIKFNAYNKAINVVKAGGIDEI